MKPIQEERMKGYFLSAAKELIRGEGLEVVSARNVAERAGYSYATLYNYFKDIRDLIFSCVEDFMAECREFVAADTQEKLSAEKALVAVSKSYSKFFVQYPGIFDLFYQEKANQISTAQSNFSSIWSLFDSLASEQWLEAAKKSGASHGRISQVQEYHKLALHGLIMMYLNKRIDNDYKKFMNKVEEVTSEAIKIL